jgi:hypothetical protein
LLSCIDLSHICINSSSSWKIPGKEAHRLFVGRRRCSKVEESNPKLKQANKQQQQKTTNNQQKTAPAEDSRRQK